MKNKYVNVGLLSLLLCLSGCQLTADEDPVLYLLQNEMQVSVREIAPFKVHGHLYDFGSKQSSVYRSIRRSIDTRPSWESFKIIQLGDSHTAADLMTRATRDVLQDYYGQGAIGWTYPAKFKNHVNRQLKYTQYRWGFKDSRVNKDRRGFPVGGWISYPKRAGGWLQIDRANSARKSRSSKDTVYLQLRAYKSRVPVQWSDTRGHKGKLRLKHDGRWHWYPIQATLPFRIQSSVKHQFELGGIWLNMSGTQSARHTRKGRLAPVSFSSMGIVGAKQSIWNRWGSGAIRQLSGFKPDMIILSYGSNEAFDRQVIGHYERTLRQKIQEVKRAFPQSLILLLGTPDMQKKDDINQTCALSRPVALSEVRRVQQKLAREQGLLYWDWQQAMGGICQNKIWQKKGLAQSDGIHFTAKGYRLLGEQLGKNLLYYFKRF